MRRLALSLLAAGFLVACNRTPTAPTGVPLMASQGEHGSAPDLEWSPTTSTGPDTYDFGTVVLPSPSSVTFTLTNTGGKSSGTVTVSLSTSSVYSITADGCTGSALGPHKTCTVTVEFAPTSGSTFTATLTADAEHGSASLDLTGAGASTTLVVKKITNGGYGTAFDYTTTGGLSPATFSLTTTAAGAAGADSLVYPNLSPGSYSVTEGTLPTGWQWTSLSCGTGGSVSGRTANITLAAGATVRCIYTNTKQSTIKIVKETTLGYGGPFPYTTTGGLSPATFNLTTTAAGAAGADSLVYPNLSPGSYSVTEGTLPTGWAFSSLSCSAGGSVSSQTANITLAAGATVRCIYRNQTTADLVLSPGTLEETTSDNTKIYNDTLTSGTTTFTVTNNGTASSLPLQVTQDMGSGISVSNNQCTGSLAPNSSCTFDITQTGPSSGAEYKVWNSSSGAQYIILDLDVDIGI